MTVSGGNAVQNSAYRSSITWGPQVPKNLRAFSFFCNPDPTKRERDPYNHEGHERTRSESSMLRIKIERYVKVRDGALWAYNPDARIWSHGDRDAI